MQYTGLELGAVRTDLEAGTLVLALLEDLTHPRLWPIVGVVGGIDDDPNPALEDIATEDDPLPDPLPLYHLDLLRPSSMGLLTSRWRPHPIVVRSVPDSADGG